MEWKNILDEYAENLTHFSTALQQDGRQAIELVYKLPDIGIIRYEILHPGIAVHPEFTTEYVTKEVVETLRGWAMAILEYLMEQTDSVAWMAYTKNEAYFKIFAKECEYEDLGVIEDGYRLFAGVREGLCHQLQQQ